MKLRVLPPLRIASVEAVGVAGSDGASDRIIFGMLAGGRRQGMLLDARKRGRENEPLGTKTGC
jgi:hypothetical protein